MMRPFVCPRQWLHRCRRSGLARAYCHVVYINVDSSIGCGGLAGLRLCRNELDANSRFGAWSGELIQADLPAVSI
jgi:hypothetical protein